MTNFEVGLGFMLWKTYVFILLHRFVTYLIVYLDWNIYITAQNSRFIFSLLHCLQTCHMAKLIRGFLNTNKYLDWVLVLIWHKFIRQILFDVNLYNETPKYSNSSFSCKFKPWECTSMKSQPSWLQSIYNFVDFQNHLSRTMIFSDARFWM